MAASPRPTFGLGDAALHGSPVPAGANAASLAAKVVAAGSLPVHAGAGQQGADPSAHLQADLSPAARLLSQVLQGASRPSPAQPQGGDADSSPLNVPG